MTQTDTSKSNGAVEAAVAATPQKANRDPKTRVPSFAPMVQSTTGANGKLQIKLHQLMGGFVPCTVTWMGVSFDVEYLPAVMTGEFFSQSRNLADKARYSDQIIAIIGGGEIGLDKVAELEQTLLTIQTAALMAQGQADENDAEGKKRFDAAAKLEQEVQTKLEQARADVRHVDGLLKSWELLEPSGDPVELTPARLATVPNDLLWAVYDQCLADLRPKENGGKN